MSQTQVGSCPKCGAPLYSPSAWWGITPPPVTYTCGCFPQPRVISTTSTNDAEELIRKQRGE